MEIQHTQQEHKGFFKAIENEQEAGRMTYSRAGEHRIIIDHTEVNTAFRGKSVGKRLLLETVDFARKNQLKILPLCPFAKRIFDRDAGISDVLDSSKT